MSIMLRGNIIFSVKRVDIKRVMEYFHRREKPRLERCHATKNCNVSNSLSPYPRLSRKRGSHTQNLCVRSEKRHCRGAADSVQSGSDPPNLAYKLQSLSHVRSSRGPVARSTAIAPRRSGSPEDSGPFAIGETAGVQGGRLSAAASTRIAGSGVKSSPERPS